MTRNNYLKIDVNIRDHFGSNTTAMVFGRLMYWFSKKPDGFYKFKQSCKKHPLYKKGDSWGEELGMSRKILDPILSRLVNHHKTKSEYLKSTDRFAGKVFCSYTNYKTNQTHYMVDREALGKFLSSISVKIAPPSPVSSEVDNSSSALKNMDKIHPSNVPGEHPLACTHPDLTVVQTNTSLSETVPSSIDHQKEKDKLISKTMVNTWNSLMQDTVTWYPSFASKLSKVLNDFFKGCLENFKRYCLTVASADFLTGKAVNSKFKAVLFWSIKPEVIQSILNGAYGVKNFFTMSDPEEREIKSDIRNLDSQIKLVESSISQSQDQVKVCQKKLVDELKATLSDKEMQSLREESDQEYYIDNPPSSPVATETRARFGFKRSISDADLAATVDKVALNFHFDAFLKRKFNDRLEVSQEFTAPAELLAKKESLQKQRDCKARDLNKLHENKKKLRQLILSPL